MHHGRRDDNVTDCIFGFTNERTGLFGVRGATGGLRKRNALTELNLLNCGHLSLLNHCACVPNAIERSIVRLLIQNSPMHGLGLMYPILPPI
jgi:hypothetical protein